MMRDVKRDEMIKKLADEIMSEHKNVSLFLGEQDFQENYIDMSMEDGTTIEEISDFSAGFVKENGEFPKGSVYLKIDGDSYDQIFLLDDECPFTDLWYKDSVFREKIDQIIKLIY